MEDYLITGLVTGVAISGINSKQYEVTYIYRVHDAFEIKEASFIIPNQFIPPTAGSEIEIRISEPKS